MVTQILPFFTTLPRPEGRGILFKKLKNDQGVFVEGTHALNLIILDYFSHLFNSEISITDPNVLDKIIPKVIEEMNAALMEPFTYIDVMKAVFTIGDLKALGPDGLHALFYKKFWHYLAMT